MNEQLYDLYPDDYQIKNEIVVEHVARRRSDKLLEKIAPKK